MGIRFRKSIKLAPGVRMNLSGSGISFGLGPRGASVSIGKRGAYLNTGLPGTGFHMRQKIGGSNRGNNKSSPNLITMTVTVEVTDNGTIEFRDSESNTLPQHIVNAAKKQQGDVIQGLIRKKCEEINGQIEAIGEIHLYTPAPNIKPQYQFQEFLKPQPTSPIPKKAGFFDKLFGSRHEKIEKENEENERKFLREIAEWQEEKEKFIRSELQRKELIESDIYTDMEAMENFLEENLQSIIWPRETVVETEIYNNGLQVFIDVDLPEIEDMPNKKATTPQRGYKLSVKEMSFTQIQQLYMKHIHGIGFRIIGEIFSALPITQEVTLSAYSQRLNASTANIKNEYLYSVQVTRNLWSGINFNNLESLDITEALAQFNIIRNMTKNGSFKPIKPHVPIR